MTTTPVERAPSRGDQFEIVGYGVDDVTFGFDMTGSRSLTRLNETPGLATRRGKMLGDQASWGQFVHLLGRSVAFWKADTLRLYVQAKLTLDGSLCSPEALGGAHQALRERMAWVGLVSYEPAWVTRLDVAVDGACRPADGKLLLDALEAVRLPKRIAHTFGWSPALDHVLLGSRERAREGTCLLPKPEAEARGAFRSHPPGGGGAVQAEECPAESIEDAANVAKIWRSRSGSLGGRVTRLSREVQTLEIADRGGELDYKQGERLAMFLELERLGVAKTYYPASVYAARRREARRLGYAISDTGSSPLDIELSALLRPYVEAVEAEPRKDAG